MKRFSAFMLVFSLLCTLLAGCGGSGAPAATQAPASAGSSQPDSFVIHASVPSSWMDIGLWAWSDTQGDLYTSWPGEPMNYDGDGWYSMGVPGWVNYVIINGFGGDVQTADLAITPREVWITVEEDGSATVNYSAPAATTAGNSDNDFYEVYAKEPFNWLEVNIWAWSDSLGDLYDAWPGEEMSYGPDGWYSVRLPKAYDKIVISGNKGEYQTADIATGAKDTWIVISEDGSHRIYTSKPAETSSAPRSNTASQYDALFDDAWLTDYPVVSSGLNVMSTVIAMDSYMMKMEFGYRDTYAEEIAVVYYFDVMNVPDDKLTEVILSVRQLCAEQFGGMSFATISDDLYNTWVVATIHCKDLDNPANAAALAEFMGADFGDLSAQGLITVPTTEEVEALGFYLKYN